MVPLLSSVLNRAPRFIRIELCYVDIVAFAAAALLFHDISAGRILQRWVLRAAHRGWCALPARAGGKPQCPVRPPAPFMAAGTLQPLLGAARRHIADLFGPVGAFATGRV